MGCFIVPLTQAIATTAMRRHFKNTNTTQNNEWINHLPILEAMLWGGSLMLMVDHIINGEITSKYPFLTALASNDGTSTLLRELWAVGVPMSLLITLVYTGMVIIQSRKKKVRTN